MEDRLPANLLNRRDAAVYLGVSASTLARWAMLRVGPSFHKLGGRVLYRISDLDQFIAQCAVVPASLPCR